LTQKRSAPTTCSSRACNPVAQEIELESAQELKPADVLEFLAQQCDTDLVGRWSGDPFLRTPGMEIRAYRVAPKGRELKEKAHAAKIGFRPKISVTFGIRKLASLPERDAAWEMMLHLVIAFAQRYPAEAVLLFEGAEVLMRCRDGEIVFDASEYFEEDLNLAAIVSQHQQETLDQPYM